MARYHDLFPRQIRIDPTDALVFLPNIERDEARDAAETFYSTGNLQPLCDIMERRYFKAFDNRDYRWTNELTVKTAFLTLLFNDIFYLMESEPPLERGYADLLMLVRPDMRQYQLLDLLLEFKYVSLKDAKLTGEAASALSPEQIKTLPLVQELFREAHPKLTAYRRVLEQRYGDLLRLRSYTVVALGFERVVWEEYRDNRD